jgi:hypothetical protein
MLTGAARFLHYALFREAALDPIGLVATLAAIVLAAGLGYRVERRRQMCQCYPWAFESAGPLSWRSRVGVAPSSHPHPNRPG